MKNYKRIITGLSIIASVTARISAIGQQQEMQYFRPNNEAGLNVFETTKNDSTPFTKMRVLVGGNFELAFQGLRDNNTAIPLTETPYIGNVNALVPLTNEFVLPMANLNVDVQLADGIRVDVTAYLASRHHEDAWVKGGYIQFDKLLFLHSDFINSIMKSVTIKVGQCDVDYGDQHFQRSDGGNTIYNPFIENYIMDEFATEIGAEVYYHNKCGLFAMGGITNGELDPQIAAATKIDSATKTTNKYEPAFHGKLGYDKQLCKNFRLRLTGSFYAVQSDNDNTLFGGDRTGSHYFEVMSSQSITNGSSLNDEYDYNAFSGRYNPGFTEQVNAFMGNLFLKFHGLQFFGTYEVANGRAITEVSDRQATQYAGDLIYRFPEHKQNFWVGVRYNSVTAVMIGDPNSITINREAGSIGCFLTKNIMMKAEYVVQKYLNYPDTNILNGGEFDGFMLEASIGF